ncbi:MAG: hypothetical protein JNL57_06695 [Bacteroidetes bacterium]|nr:hypothetical protein [Bacteroidota bacterium]
MKRLIHIVFTGMCMVLLLTTACSETQITTGNPVPALQLQNLTPTNLQQFKDSVTVTLMYEDGDGDLGFENADINSLEVQDDRLSKPDYYYVAPLAPLTAKIHIKGTLALKLRNLFLLGTGNAETTVLRLRIKDRAGNWSNTVTTPEITIRK